MGVKEEYDKYENIIRTKFLCSFLYMGQRRESMCVCVCVCVCVCTWFSAVFHCGSHWCVQPLLVVITFTELISCSVFCGGSSQWLRWLVEVSIEIISGHCLLDFPEVWAHLYACILSTSPLWESCFSVYEAMLLPNFNQIFYSILQPPLRFLVRY